MSLLLKDRDWGLKSFLETKAGVKKQKISVEEMNNNAKAMFLYCGNGFNPSDFKVNLHFLGTFSIMFCSCLISDSSGGREEWTFTWVASLSVGLFYTKVWEEGRRGSVA